VGRSPVGRFPAVLEVLAEPTSNPRRTEKGVLEQPNASLNLAITFSRERLVTVLERALPI
jgi:hypothetical protein